jgi:argininosuccinate lyase
VPFRTAYRQVADGLAGLAARTPAESLAARVSPGATANLMLGVLHERLAALRVAR